MQILISALVFGLLGLDAAAAAKSPKLSKRAITVNRVASGWVERDVLHMKVQAMQKYGMPMSDSLKQAHVVNRAQAKVRAQTRQSNVKAAGADAAGGDLLSGLTGGAGGGDLLSGLTGGTGGGDLLSGLLSGLTGGTGGGDLLSGLTGGGDAAAATSGGDDAAAATAGGDTGNAGGETGSAAAPTKTAGESPGDAAGVSTVTVTVTKGEASPEKTRTGAAGEGSTTRTGKAPKATGTGNAGGARGNGTEPTRATGTRSSGTARPTGSTGSSGNGTQATDQTGNVANVPERGDVEYLSEVVIGGQKIVMNFDTGSSDFWVFSTNLNANSQKNHTVYDPSKSATFAASPNQKSFQIKFGDGSSASGSSPNTIGTDVVSIGGAVAQKATIELADTVSGSFVTDTQSNGLVGFAFSKINTVKPVPAKTFFDTVADDLEQPILAADLRPGQPGSYSLGKVDTTAFKGQLTEVPINNTQGFWQFQSSSFSVAGGQTQQNTQNSPAIADTGTTLLLADDDVVNGYYSQVPNAELDPQTGLVTYPCASTLPDLSLAIGSNYNAVIPGTLINFQPIDAANTTCAGALQSNSGAGIQIYGDIFFKAQYTVFNVRNNTISVAPHS